jgi:hypothetical protein
MILGSDSQLAEQPRSGDTGWYLFLGRNLHDDLDLPDFEALMAQTAKQGTTQ